MVNSQRPAISVLGTGYVGLSTATLLAEAGYRVYALDIDPKRLQTISEGRSFFYEEGIDPLIEHAVKSKKLIPTSSYEEAIPESSFIFSCVGTPDNPDGSSNLSYVFSAAEEALQYMRSGAIYIQKSTVPVGTGKKVQEVFKQQKKSIPYVSNPEFLREGTAIVDSLWPDRVVIGSDDKNAAEKVAALYKDIEDQRSKIAARAGIKPPGTNKPTYFITNQNSAELIKVTANAFLTAKKGKPFQSLETRSLIVSGIAGVDYVVPFEIENDQTVCKALEELKPDIFTKGGDRNTSTLPEAETAICKKYGIKVMFGVGEDKKWSSSEFLKNWDGSIPTRLKHKGKKILNKLSI